MHSLREHAPHKTWPDDYGPAQRQEILGKLVNQGDVWLRTHLADYVDYVMKEENNSLLIITWDEDSGGKGCKHPCPTSSPANHIPTILVGAKVKSGYRSSIQVHALQSVAHHFGHVRSSANRRKPAGRDNNRYLEVGRAEYLAGKGVSITWGSMTLGPSKRAKINDSESFPI